MSRVSFESTYERSPVRVTGGWDYPFQEFFLHVERTAPKWDEKEVVWLSLLDTAEDDFASTAKLREKLGKLGIEPPPYFWDLIEVKARNHSYVWRDSRWSRP